MTERREGDKEEVSDPVFLLWRYMVEDMGESKKIGDSGLIL